MGKKEKSPFFFISSDILLIYAVCELRGSRGSYSSPSGDMSSPGNMVCEILGEL